MKKSPGFLKKKFIYNFFRLKTLRFRIKKITWFKLKSRVFNISNLINFFLRGFIVSLRGKPLFSRFFNSTISTIHPISIHPFFNSLFNRMIHPFRVWFTLKGECVSPFWRVNPFLRNSFTLRKGWMEGRIGLIALRRVVLIKNSKKKNLGLFIVLKSIKTLVSGKKIERELKNKRP